MGKLFLSESNKDIFKDKVVLLRIDCDVDLRSDSGKLIIDEDFRLRSVLPTINFLKDAGVKKIILLGHLGRPVAALAKGGKPEEKAATELSLKPVARWFSEKIGDCSLVTDYQLPVTSCLSILENLRFSPGEESNDQSFVKKLAILGDVFVNDAFGASHRPHASIIGLPKLLPSFLGLRFEAEMKTLSWVKEKPKKPLVFVLGGSKEDKLGYLEFLGNWADQVLIGGKLPLLMHKLKIKMQNGKSKLKIARLKDNQKDISDQSIKEFIEDVRQAAMVLWAGPMGVYEEKENQKGTFEIAKAIAQSSVFKLAAGGDTHRVLSWTKTWQKFDFVSVGGGAALQFLKDETLPGIEAIKIKK